MDVQTVKSVMSPGSTDVLKIGSPPGIVCLELDAIGSGVSGSIVISGCSSVGVLVAGISLVMSWLSSEVPDWGRLVYCPMPSFILCGPVRVSDLVARSLFLLFPLSCVFLDV